MITSVEVQSVQINKTGNYMLMLTNETLLWCKNLNSGKYELKKSSSIEFERDNLIEQCCSCREEIKYLFLKLSPSFGAAQLNVLLRASEIAIEQVKSIDVFHTIVKDIKIVTPNSLERYQNIITDFNLSPQDIEGVKLNELAIKYHYGEGVEKDMKEAINLYNKSADKGNAESQVSLYYILLSGDGVEQDENKALFWLMEAAEQGSSDARELLAECYYQGDGVERDLDKARDLYRYAAIQGNVGAQHQLGRMYHHGIGVESNLKNAVKWYELSKRENKYADIEYELGCCYERGDETNGLQKNIEKAIQCYSFSAEYNNADALCALGLCYEFGRGVKMDLKKAMDYYLKSIEHGADEIAWSLLGSIFYRFEDVRDYDKAIYYLTAAAEKNIPHSQTELAYCYYYGHDDKLTAVDWFLKAAKNGDMMAAQALNFLDFK